MYICTCDIYLDIKIHTERDYYVYIYIINDTANKNAQWAWRILEDLAQHVELFAALAKSQCVCV